MITVVLVLILVFGVFWHFDKAEVVVNWIILGLAIVLGLLTGYGVSRKPV